MLGLKHRRSIAMIVAVLGLVVALSIIVEPCFAWAKGGRMFSRSPRPFTREELILIEKCRIIARSRGIESIVFARECSTVRP
jgi:hypothetical protein